MHTNSKQPIQLSYYNTFPYKYRWDKLRSLSLDPFICLDYSVRFSNVRQWKESGKTILIKVFEEVRMQGILVIICEYRKFLIKNPLTANASDFYGNNLPKKKKSKSKNCFDWAENANETPYSYSKVVGNMQILILPLIMNTSRTFQRLS